MVIPTPFTNQVENLYRFRGFHPVHLGDGYKENRYLVIHKLGHGGFATVWLGRDQVRKRYVALKVLASEVSQNCPEVDILRRLRSSPEHSGKAYIMSLLDHFWIHGPNGSHLCVVSQVAGPSIKQFNRYSGRLRASVARKVALQVTMALDYVHSAGVVHGGIYRGISTKMTSANRLTDFTSSNILLKLANIDKWSVEQIYERLGKPQTRDLAATPGTSPESAMPRYIVNAINMNEIEPQWLSDQIIIIDFGLAFLQDQSSLDMGTPKSYYAPELLFDDARSVSSDVWALGCALFEIRTGTSLFHYKSRPSRNQILISMVNVLGDLPERWWSEWEEGRKWYKKKMNDGEEHAEPNTGSLYHQILETGSNDGVCQASSSPEDESLAHDSADDDKNSSSIDRIISFIGGLSDYEAADIIMRVAQSTSSSVNKSNLNSESSSKSKPKSSSSNCRSADKRISSEGISTGVVSTSPANQIKNVIGMEALGVIGLIDDEMPASVDDFIEPVGTIISISEARGLENLLRKALNYLPEQRSTPAELAKHRWFFDDFRRKD